MILGILTNMKKIFGILGRYRITYFFIALFLMMILVEEYIHITGDGSIGVLLMLGFPLYLITLVVVLYDIVLVYFNSKTSANKKFVIGIYIVFLILLLLVFPIVSYIK